MAGFVFLSERQKDKAKNIMFSYDLAQLLFLKERSVFIHIINSTSQFSAIKIANTTHTPYPETCLSLAVNEGRDVMPVFGLGGPVTAL